MLRSRHRRRSSATAQAAQIEQRARRRSSLPATSPISASTDATSAKQKEELGMDVDNEKPDAKDTVVENPQEPSQQTPLKADSPLARKPPNPVNPLDRADEDMSDLTNSMSALRFVPPSIR